MYIQNLERNKLLSQHKKAQKFEPKVGLSLLEYAINLT